MGLLFGSLLKGAGEGAEKGIMIDERQRAEAAAASDRFAQMDYAARKGEEAKAAEQARRDKRLSEFKGEADQWRKENPKASLTDFVSHFAGTQYGDLLQPMVQAANLEGAEKERALRMLSIQAQDRRSAAADARAARGEERASVRDAIALRRLQNEEASAQEAKDREQRKKGLLEGYLRTKANDPQGEAAYNEALVAEYGVSPRELFFGKAPDSEVSRKTLDAEGNETTTKTKERGAPGKSFEKLVEGAERTAETFKGNPVFKTPEGMMFYYRNGVPHRLGY